MALVALDAVVHTAGPLGDRAIAIDDFFLLPGDTADKEHPLEHGELIMAVEVPPRRIARRSAYLKFRDRESYEFALVSVAAAVSTSDGSASDGSTSDGSTITDVRLALGGVGTKPWRARRAERSLLGQPGDPCQLRPGGRRRAGAGDAAAGQRVQDSARAARCHPRPEHTDRKPDGHADGRITMTTITRTSAIGQPVHRVDGPGR